MTAFPGAEASFTGFTASHTLAADSHASQHNLEQTEIVATQHKIGTGASTPTSGLVLRGNGVGTSAWGQAVLTTDVSGVLPQANGGTGTALATGTGKVVYDTSPTVSNPTITGGGSWAGSPTITTPTIASFTNANHNHQNAAGGGQIAAAAITSLDLTNTTLSNPYKFSVYRTAATNSGNNAYAIVNFDTKSFDTSSNVDIVTNKGRFTAPIAGFYFFSAYTETDAAMTNFITALFKNGSEIKRGDKLTGGGTTAAGSNVNGFLQLIAGDFVEVYCFANTAVALKLGNVENYFDGFLVSTT